MWLIFDFDGTITVRDTIQELSQACINFQKQHFNKDLSDAWQQVVSEYMEDRRQHLEGSKAQRQQWGGSGNTLQMILKYLGSWKDVEARSLERVRQSGIFAGITTANLFQMGVDAKVSGRVKIRDGFEELIQLAEGKGWHIGVISVNWSRSFILGVLSACNVNMRVITNEISIDGQVLGPDPFGSPLTTALDKDTALKDMTSQLKEKVFYFGDSETDLPCILHGGTAITGDIGETSNLVCMIRLAGYDLEHVNPLQGPTALSWANDFQQVLQSGLFGE